MTLARELRRRKARRKLESYHPYAKQKTFHTAGAIHRERLFMAGNQLGKTWAGGMELAMHLTGQYPDWWEGRRFEGAGRWWAAGKTRVSTRDSVQKILVGEPEIEDEWGTGTIPADRLRSTSRAMGVANALDSLTVRHVSGEVSTLLFKSYEAGREKWQADTLHGVWFDEEPPLDIYTEGKTRTNATGGLVFLTFTPLLGMSDVVRMFLTDHDLRDMRGEDAD